MVGVPHLSLLPSLPTLGAEQSEIGGRRRGRAGREGRDRVRLRSQPLRLPHRLPDAERASNAKPMVPTSAASAHSAPEIQPAIFPSSEIQGGIFPLSEIRRELLFHSEIPWEILPHSEMRDPLPLGNKARDPAASKACLFGEAGKATCGTSLFRTAGTAGREADWGYHVWT